MSFDVPGTVQSILVKEGDQVKEGQELARLNQEIFKNALAAAQAEFNRTKAQMERVLAAAKSNAVSKQDVSNAEADHDVAKSKLAVTQKSLDDTVLHASFDGVVASIEVKEFENVQAKQRLSVLLPRSSTRPPGR